MKKNLFLSLLLALATNLMAVAQESLTFAYATKDAPVSPVGTTRIDNYDVAIAITNPSVYGMAVTAIEVPVFPSAKLSNLSAWIAPQLRLEQQGAVKVNVPDVSFPLEMPATGNDVEWVTVTLAEPYVVPEGGAYVGYSFAVEQVDNSDDITKYPVVTTPGATPGGFYFHTTRTYKTWEDRSEALNATAMIQVTLQGSTIPANAARLGPIPANYVAMDRQNTIDVMVYNIGTEPIRSLGYTTATDNGQSVSVEKTLDTPIEAVFGAGAEVEFLLPAFTSEGTHEVTIEVNAVNGTPCAAPAAKGNVHVALFVPRHNALVEEYTGMWCGNCPRGFVAMEYMSRHFADFIGIAYHNRDALAMELGDPGLVNGYPGATIDRRSIVDPYFADPTSNLFSMPDVWQRACQEFTPAELAVTARWDEASQTVETTSTLNWAIVPEDAATANYRLEYVLIADGLADASWYQTNYYADGANGYPDLMDEFTHGKKYVFGLVYNDAAILTSGFRGVKGSVPSIKVGETTTHTLTFDTEETYNVSGEKIPFLKDRLRVVAIVLKGAGTGEVVNAAQCSVATEGNSIAAPDFEESPILSVENYDLQGRRLSAPAGLHLQRIRYANGKTFVRKVIN